MRRITSLRDKIEAYVADWHGGYDTLKLYAFDLGKSLFAFIRYIEDMNLSERTKGDHIVNAYYVGTLESKYGNDDNFNILNLKHAVFFEPEFKRKISDSKYAVQSYKSTCNKLTKFIESGLYKKYLQKIEDELGENDETNDE